MSDCIGVTDQRELCNKRLKEDNVGIFCNAHKHQEKFSKKVLKEILNGTNIEYKNCGHCKHWHNEETAMCLSCLGYYNEQNKKKKLKKGKLCKGMQKNGEPCNKTSINDTLYCYDHKYMINYTQDMLDNMRYCTGSCKRYIYIEGEFKSCQYCRDRGKNDREIARKEKVKTHSKCLTCENPENLKLGNGYCGKCDDVQMKKNAIIASGKKVCSRWHHDKGCLEALEMNDPYSICVVCRGVDAKADKIKRDDVKNKSNKLDNENEELLEQVEDYFDEEHENKKLKTKVTKVSKLMNVDLSDFNDENIDGSDNEAIDAIIEKTFKICTHKNCTCKGDKQPITNFCGPHGEITAHCKDCRNKNKLSSANRKRKPYVVDPEKLKAKYERQKQYRQNNKTLMAVRDKLYKLMEKEKLGEDEYFKKKAQEAKEYREKNHERVRLMENIRNAKFEARVKIYKDSAKARGIKWLFDESNDKDISKLEILIKSYCHYCGEMNNNKLNGLDRVNNNGSYCFENVVSCCEICNFMKGELTYLDYKKIAKHIISYVVNLLDFSCPDLFKNRGGSFFSEYVERAEEYKKLNFALDKFDFNCIQVLNCYMCGKETNDQHVNGIDRIDNSIGYNHDNCLPCCGTCNYIKNKFSIEDVFRKLYKNVCRFEGLPIGNIDELYEIVQGHIDSEKEYVKMEINSIKQFSYSNTQEVDTFKNENIKPVTINQISDEKPKKISKKSIVVDDQKNKKSENFVNSKEVEIGEKPKKISKKNVLIEKLKDVIEEKKLNDEVVELDKINVLKTVGINQSTIKNKLTKENNIEKYGEEGYKSLDALRQKKSYYSKRNDLEMVTKIEKEINEIKDGAIVHKKVKLTPKQKTAKKTLQKQNQRKQEIEKYGIGNIRKKRAEERQTQRTKKEQLKKEEIDFDSDSN
jgi:hypothetical protein